MTSLLKHFSTACLLVAATTGSAMAQLAGGPKGPNVVPEPGSLALVGLAIGVAVLVARKGRK